MRQYGIHIIINIVPSFSIIFSFHFIVITVSVEFVGEMTPRFLDNESINQKDTKK